MWNDAALQCVWWTVAGCSYMLLFIKELLQRFVVFWRVGAIAALLVGSGVRLALSAPPARYLFPLCSLRGDTDDLWCWVEPAFMWALFAATTCRDPVSPRVLVVYGVGCTVWVLVGLVVQTVAAESGGFYARCAAQAGLFYGAHAVCCHWQLRPVPDLCHRHNGCHHEEEQQTAETLV